MQKKQKAITEYKQSRAELLRDSLTKVNNILICNVTLNEELRHFFVVLQFEFKYLKDERDSLDLNLKYDFFLSCNEIASSISSQLIKLLCKQIVWLSQPLFHRNESGGTLHEGRRARAIISHELFHHKTRRYGSQLRNE